MVVLCSKQGSSIYLWEGSLRGSVDLSLFLYSWLNSKLLCWRNLKQDFCADDYNWDPKQEIKGKAVLCVLGAHWGIGKPCCRGAETPSADTRTRHHG